MTLTLALALTGLALVDSTSIGTLVVPIWLLLQPGRPRPIRIMAYLLTVAGFYLVVGTAIALGASVVLDDLTPLVTTRAAYVVELLIGLALFTASFFLGSKRRRHGGSAERTGRWRDRAVAAGSVRGLMALAVVAASIEVATMLPYLAAIGLIATSDLGVVGRGFSLLAYCLVMILPAVVLLVLRMTVHDRVEPFLQRVNGWMSRNTSAALAWTVGIIGFLVARDAAWRLGAFDWIQTIG